MRPGRVEIGDQSLEALGSERRIEARHVGELINRVVRAGIERAPEPPAPLGFEFTERHRQMIFGIPAIEALPQRRFDDGADDEIGFGHGAVPIKNNCAAMLLRSRGAPLASSLRGDEAIQIGASAWIALLRSE